jgi:hypothetical protein
MSKKKRLDLAAFEQALDPGEAAAYASFQEAFKAEGADHGAIRRDFFTWAGPVVSRLGGGHPGAIWGIFSKKNRPKKEKVEIRPLPELANRLPYPLGFKVREVLQARHRLQEGESEPQYPFMLCAVTGVLLRFAALISIKAYVDQGKSNPELNHLIVARLRKPSDGGWLELSQRVSKSLDKGSPLVDLMIGALSRKPALSKDVQKLAKGGTQVQQALSMLVAFRNDLLHGHTISDERLQQAGAWLEVAIRGFASLGEYHLDVRHLGQTWRLNGAVPRPVDSPYELPEDEPCLVHSDGKQEPFSLSPLLRFRPGEGESQMDVDFDELFFLNAGSLERLSYIGYRASGQVDGKALGSYDAFKSFMSNIPTPPIPQDPRIDFSGFAEFHARLFVGRQDVLSELSKAVADGASQYAVLKALAGMGKSAIFATLLQAVRNLQLPEGKRIPTVADALVRPDDRWVFHFCMPTDGRNSPTVAFRSLIAQLCDHFGLKRKDWLTHDLDELKDEKFPALVAQVSKSLGEGERIVIVIDALDEGMGAEKETVASCIPAGEYPGVVFLLSFRVDEQVQNTRVEKELRHLAEDRRPVLSSATPLIGLSVEDVRQYLDKCAALKEGAPSATDETRAAVWNAAIQDSDPKRPSADPFYLRFVSDGVQSGDIRLARAETVPGSLDDAFEEMWMGLPQEEDFLCHRVLLTLGIMREYGDDELFAALFNRDRPAEKRLVPNDIAAVRVKAGKLLVYDEDRYGLFHDRFRRFLVGEQKDPIAEALGMG